MGMKCFLVGGFVRDLQLERANYDLDIAAEGDGIGLAKEINKKVGGKLVAYKRFGTATLVSGNIRIDIATTRREKYKEPAAMPQVFFSTLKEDLSRRDFTINAMALNINKKTFGQFIDFFGGTKDLEEKKIRVLHDKSFIDDPTRIFRAVRFEQRFGFSIEEHTESLIKEAAKMEMVSKTEFRRIRNELILILKEKDAGKVLLRLREVYGLKFILPDPAAVNSEDLEKQVRGLIKKGRDQ